jgi:hypothetical protein
MSLGNLPDNKLFSLALHGYNAYQPECGIFCGGYQGLIYPNPTTLSYPGFDPYQYLESIASEYTPDVQYTGLDIGNPGIDYKNPGHILGLLDTFGRMSYGISILRAVHNGNSGDDGINPIVAINIPMIGLDENTTLGLDDIYPSISEAPGDWVNSYLILANGTVTPDPRPFISFSAGSGHSPILNPLDAEAFNNLFLNKTILSYYGMPQYFRSIIEALYSAAEPLVSKAELDFTLNSPHMFNNYAHLTNFFPNISSLDNHELLPGGLAVNQCKVLTPSEALKITTGFDNYHDGADGMNEYRSLTELNSVINLVPIQMIGATYWLDDHTSRVVYPPGGGIVYEVDEWTGRSFTVASYMIVDLVINISDIPIDLDNPDPGTVTIEGIVKVKPIITNPEAYRWNFTHRPIPDPDPGWEYDSPLSTLIDGAEESINRQVHIAMSMTNKYTWDRSWLGSDQISSGETFGDQIEDWTLGGNSNIGFSPADTTILEVPFSKTFTLCAGCTSVRMRIFCRNQHKIGYDGDLMVHPDYWVPYSMLYPDWVLLLPNIGEYITVYPRGTISTGWENDPTAVKNAMDMSNIEVSFTMAGTKFDPIVYEVSL